MQPVPSILFLCTGNAARSVMAGAALSALGGCAVVTAGTLTIEGQPMSHRTRNAMAGHRLVAPAHRSRQARAGDLADADLVVGLAREHVEWVRREHPAQAWKTGTLRRLARDLPSATSVRALGLAEVELGAWEDIDDPGGGELPDFERACAEVVPLVEALHRCLTDRQRYITSGPTWT